MIRKAEEKDIPRLIKLLRQVHDVHSAKRPDIFRAGSKKYDENELKNILSNETSPVFVAERDSIVIGYVFCIYQSTKNDKSLMDRETLYIDDLCVDETLRGKGIGNALFNYVKTFAEKNGFNDIVLNVWECNAYAKKFYEKLGLMPRKTVLEFSIIK